MGRGPYPGNGQPASNDVFYVDKVMEGSYSLSIAYEHAETEYQMATTIKINRPTRKSTRQAPTETPPAPVAEEIQNPRVATLVAYAESQGLPVTTADKLPVVEQRQAELTEDMLGGVPVVPVSEPAAQTATATAAAAAVVKKGAWKPVRDRYLAKLEEAQTVLREMGFNEGPGVLTLGAAITQLKAAPADWRPKGSEAARPEAGDLVTLRPLYRSNLLKVLDEPAILNDLVVQGYSDDGKLAILKGAMGVSVRVPVYGVLAVGQ